MAFKTCINGDRDIFAGMAILAAIGIRFMQNIPHQCRTVTAMRIVTGTTITQVGRKIGVFLLNCCKRMTTLAKRLRFFDQKIGIWRLMRFMAGGALSFDKRRMVILELPWHLRVALEADIRGRIVEQGCLVRGMRIVATQALTLFYRHMHYALELFFGRLGVT
jgi:hypothetical protein